jgi:hypothetical protein
MYYLQSGLLLESVDEAACASVMRCRLAGVIELGKNLLSQALAQLNTPLVEAVDVPDGALGEGQVLVIDDERSKSCRSDFVCKDRGGWSVAQERLVGDQVLRSTLGLDLVRSLADHEGLCLSKEVGRKHPIHVSYLSRLPVVINILLVLVVLHWVVALSS